MIGFAIESLYAIVFIQALLSYLRHRDPLQRDVTLVFTPVVLIFLLQIVVFAFGEDAVPFWASLILVISLLAQPYLTLRLVRTLRPVSRWLVWGSLVAALLSATPLFFFGEDTPSGLALVIIAVFTGGQTTAAVYLAREARRRAGAPRTRLRLASGGTALFGIALLASAVAQAVPAARGSITVSSNVIALLSAVSYVVAFLPPPWLRQLWSRGAAYTVFRRLMEGSTGESPARTWMRYAETVREVSGADATVVLIPAENGEAKVMASAGTGAFAGNLPFANLRGDVSGGDRPSGDFAGGDLPSGDFTGGDVPGADFTGGDLVVTEADLRRLLTGPQPTKLSAGPYPDADNSMLSRASQAGLLFAVAVPLELPVAEYGLASARGLVVFLSRHRALFIEDDARLLGELGAQAAIMAERGSALAEQERLADELAESVTSLQAASQAKTDFLANMSHELRTPLNAIIGFSELMRTEPEAADDRRVVPVEWIDHIFASGQHLLGLINDILDLAKIEAGRMDLRPELVDLPAVVSDVVTTLHPLVDAKHLRLATAIPPITVRADRVRLRQILDNLLSNAIKFTPEEGHIFVGASDIGPDVRITVADTGPGIAPADHERIFDEFQQVGDPMKHQAGTGLGLALTRRLIQAHGGAIGLESDLGHGSRFTVHLPNLAPREDATLLADEPGSKILLIEDEPSSARLLQTYLETTGYSVVVAHSGEEGVAEAQRCAPAAVLLDVLLPGIDGWEVLRRFKDDPMLRSVPVFMVTVVDEREVGLALGAADYFVKPIDRRLLLSRLAELLMPAAPAGEVTAVLAVDEDPRSLDLIASSLRHHGFDVSTAATGEQGLTLARTHSFDLIITDLMMSDTDGFTLIDALDQHPATREIPVLVLTSRNPAEFAEAEFAVAPHGKVLGILPKGLDIQEALREWLTIRLAPEAETVGEVKGDR